MKPRLSFDLWEDEGIDCLEVEVEGIRIARRVGECRYSRVLWNFGGPY